ncbi:hypothetical protein OEW28_05320 [Defluviimonas sp. WL0002]|uniref:Pilus assembly protein n=1 Tax=Albidovulum marisflavi TaxID=2984159 RepID=A0ABT2ZAI4_9RHOB|nr:hypothetical protein [Defluviimonas sp. WL0002]MCV2868042.1 hypothetical protein [Defluviimonas sp. WL0002]
MKLLKNVKKFAAADAGAVTVDWVVLTSLVVVLGVWSLSLYTNGALKATNEIENYLSGITLN